MSTTRTKLDIGTRVIAIAAVCAATFVATACGGGGSGGSDSAEDGPGAAAGDYSSLSGTISIDGSSTVGPIAEAAAEEFGNVSGVNLVVGISGTGGGFEKFCRGETDISDASRPAKTSEVQACADDGIKMAEFRIAIDGLTVAVHPENTWAQCLTFSQLRTIFGPGSTVNNWSQVDPSFPDQPLTVFSPGTDSGTFDYFTEEVNGAIDESRSEGVTFSEDDNVLVLGVASDKGAIGYFGYAYYIQNQDKLRALELDRDIDRSGQPAATRQGCVAPTAPTVVEGLYPLSRPLFMYVDEAALQERQEVAAFIEFVLTNPQLVEEVGYVKLQDNVYQQNLAKLEATR